MKKVLILHDRNGLNFDGVEEFGEPSFIIEANVHPADIGKIRDATIEAIEHFGQNDYLLVTASIVSSIIMGIICSTLREYQDHVNVLIFDSKHEKYIERRLSL